MARNARSGPVQVGLGVGLFLLVGTGPIQVALATRVTPPAWIVAVSAISALLASTAAFGAAYYAMQQARQVGLARRADHYLPLLQTITDRSHDVMAQMRAIASLPSPHFEVTLAKKLPTAAEKADDLLAASSELRNSEYASVHDASNALASGVLELRDAASSTNVVLLADSLDSLESIQSELETAIEVARNQLLTT